MKILFYIHHLGGGGAERVTSIVANELVKRGHDIHIVHFVEYGDDWFPLDERIHLHYMSPPWAKRKKRYGFRYGHLWELRQKIKEINPDVCISVLPHNYWRLMLAMIGLKIPLIASDHQNTTYNVTKMEAFVRRHLYKYATAVTVLTKNDQKFMSKWMHNITVMYNPVSFPRLDYNTTRGNNILCVGRLWAFNQAKGFDRMIKMWGKISPKYPEWTLFILGDGGDDDFKYYIDLTKEENVENTVRFLGYRFDVQGWMSTCSIFALPSREEGFPCVLLEAMSQKCPPVAFEIHGNINEILTDGYDGYVVKDGDLDAFQEKLEYLMTHKKERERIANNAYESVLRFTPEKIADQWEEFLTGVVNKKKKKQI